MEKNFSKRLKEAMEKSGIKQVDLVNKTGLSKASISGYVNGNFMPKGLNISKIAKALNVDQSWLEGRINITDMRTKQLIESFNKLNDLGKEEAIKRIKELSYVNKYILINNLE